MPDTDYVEEDRAEALRMLRFVEQRVKEAQDSDDIYAQMDHLKRFLGGWQVIGGTLEEMAKMEVEDEDDMYGDGGEFVKALADALKHA